MSRITHVLVGLGAAGSMAGAVAVRSAVFEPAMLRTPAAAMAAAPVAAGPNLCLQCHLTNGTTRSRAHLLAFQRSVHVLNDVGCASCHGGDPAAIDPMRAHLKVLGPEDPDSPINPVNIPATCGVCHTAIFTQYKLSRHYEVLKAASAERAPSCTTCHADGATMPNADSVGQMCAQCHRAGAAAGHTTAPAVARMQMLEFVWATALLDEAANFIELIPDEPTRAGFRTELARSKLGLKLASEASHAVKYDSTEDRLTVALERVLAMNRRLMSTLVEAKIK